MDDVSLGGNVTESSEFLMPPSFPLDYRIVATILHSVLLVIGVAGNGLCIIVVYRTRAMHVPTYCYLVSLAAADLISILTCVPEALISYHTYAHQWLSGQVGCSLFVFCSFLGINASSLSILAFTVERFVVVCKPLHAKIINTFSRAKRTVIGIWIAAFLTASPWLFTTVVFQHPLYANFEVCHYRFDPDKYRYIFGADFLFFYLIPLVISCVMYVKMNTALTSQILMEEIQTGPNSGNLLRRVSRHTARMFGSNLETPASGDPSNILNIPLWQPANELRKKSVVFTSHSSLSNCLGASALASLSRPRLQVVRMLLMVVVCFAVLFAPYRAVSLYNSFATRPVLNKWFMLFAKSCIFLNASIDPLLYSAMSTRFRKAVLELLCPGKASSSKKNVQFN